MIKKKSLSGQVHPDLGNLRGWTVQPLPQQHVHVAAGKCKWISCNLGLVLPILLWDIPNETTGAWSLSYFQASDEVQPKDWISPASKRCLGCTLRDLAMLPMENKGHCCVGFAVKSCSPASWKLGVLRSRFSGRGYMAHVSAEAEARSQVPWDGVLGSKKTEKNQTWEVDVDIKSSGDWYELMPWAVSWYQILVTVLVWDLLQDLFCLELLCKPRSRHL